MTQLGPMRGSLRFCAEVFKKILSFQWIECKPGVVFGIFATTSAEPIEESRTFVYLDPNNLKATTLGFFHLDESVNIPFTFKPVEFLSFATVRILHSQLQDKQPEKYSPPWPYLSQ